MLVRRSMPDCGAVTRTIAFGGNRWPTNSACWGLRARMTPSRSATVSTLPARNRDPVCRSPDRCSDRRPRSRPATSTPLRSGYTAASGRANGRKPPLTPAAVAKRPAAKPVAAMASRTHCGRSPSARPSAGSEAQIRLPSASSNATNANIGTLCWVARNRSPQAGVASRTSSNCATAASSVRAPSAMLSMSPFSSCACCSDSSPSCARRSSQSLYSTQAPSTMTGSRQVSTTSNSRVDSRMLWRRPPMSGDARCLGTTRHRSLPIP